MIQNTLQQKAGLLDFLLVLPQELELIGSISLDKHTTLTEIFLVYQQHSVLSQTNIGNGIFWN